MTLKSFFDNVLSNRFTRLLSLCVMYFAFFAVSLAVAISIDKTELIFFPSAVFAICFLGQLLGDVLNVDGFLNGTFVTLIKRILFFVGVAAVGIICAGVSLAAGLSNMMEAGSSFVAIGFEIAPLVAVPVTFFAYVIAYILHSKNYHSEENKRWFPLIFLISYGASLALSILAGFLFDLLAVDYNTLSLILGLSVVGVIVIAIIVSAKCETWVFEESCAYYDSTPSRSTSSYTPTRSEYQRFREKCDNCRHVQSCRITENETFGISRNADYCDLTGREVDRYSDCCSHFDDIAK